MRYKASQIFGGGLFLCLILGMGGTLARSAAQEIRISQEHPTYFEYQGRPVLLLGGSVEDNLFQIPELEAHLDLLASCGGNYIRNTMSSRDEGNVWPFHRQEDGRYDLRQWNETYWERFERLLRETAERDIIVQIEVWATFDHYRDVWDVNPFNPKNNRNYDTLRTDLPTKIPTHPIYRNNPFFWSVPSMDNNSLLMRYQQAYVDKMLSHSLKYGNVLYCMDNETTVTSEWGRFWAQYIQLKARLAGKKVLCTEMWDAWDLSHPQHFETLHHPEIYAFADISQNNHQTHQQHWDNGLDQMHALAQLGYLRPLTNVKVYGNDGGRHKTTNQGIEAFIQNVLMGCASTRFHRPTSGQGLNEKAQHVIRVMRKATEMVNVFEAVPDNTLLSAREEGEAYCMVSGGLEYLVYFPDGGSVVLDLAGTTGQCSLQWCEVLRADWSQEKTLKRRDEIRLECPGKGHWIAIVKAL